MLVLVLAVWGGQSVKAVKQRSPTYVHYLWWSSVARGGGGVGGGMIAVFLSGESLRL